MELIELIAKLIEIKWFLTKRLICRIKGCDLEYSYEQQYLSEVWCNRCNNYHNYASMGKPDKNLFINKGVK